MQTLPKAIIVSLLGLTYTFVAPLTLVRVFDDGISSTKAYADVPRDPGRVKKERNKDNPG